MKKTTNSDEKIRRRFRLGIALIAINYVLWAAAFAFGALALSRPGFPWLRLGAVAFVLSWIAFGAGVALAGPRAVNHVRDRAIQYLRRPR